MTRQNKTIIFFSSLAGAVYEKDNPDKTRPVYPSKSIKRDHVASQQPLNVISVDYSAASFSSTEVVVAVKKMDCLVNSKY